MKFQSRILLTLAGLILAAIASAQARPSLSELEITDKVRSAILQLPYYGVFDLIAFGVDGNTVTLTGDVYRASLKKEAVDAVRKIPGVRVVDKIEVLPTSIDDDRIRSEVFRKIYTDGFLSKYGTPVPGFTGLRQGRRYWGRSIGSWPGFRTGMWGRAPFLGMEPLGNYGIHIIVKGGDVTLFGTVSSEADKTKAGLDARSVFGVHNVDNEIQVVRE
jgi:hyperosmotically inducible periplasmic protein